MPDPSILSLSLSLSLSLAALSSLPILFILRFV